MPELPEVEYARRRLAEWLEGERVSSVRAAKSRVLRGSSPKALERLLVGHRVARVERRGKWLRFILDEGALYVHLGMTGKLVRREPGDPEVRFERAAIDTRRSSVRYLDMRLFGRLVPSPDGKLADWDALGRDPLSDGLDGKQLAEALSSSRSAIKVALLDQERIAGVGNIQATEALWRAKIAPTRPASSLSAREWRELARAIRESIDFTLKAQAPEEEIAYVEEPGTENPFRVYGRAGEPCPRCRTKLLKKSIGGRTTAFCPRCQR